MLFMEMACFQGASKSYEYEKKILFFQLILFSLAFTATEAAITASKQYVMDQRSDCINTGFIDMPRDQTTYVRGRSSQSSQSQLTCYLQFSPQTEGDTLKLWIVSGSYIQDCDVILEIQMSNNDNKTLGCQSNFDSIPELKDINGKATIRLTRKTYDDVSYSFQIGITALRSEAALSPGDASSADDTLITGMVVDSSLEPPDMYGGAPDLRPSGHLSFGNVVSLYVLWYLIN